MLTRQLKSKLQYQYQYQYQALMAKAPRLAMQKGAKIAFRDLRRNGRVARAGGNLRRRHWNAITQTPLKVL